MKRYNYKFEIRENLYPYSLVETVIVEADNQKEAYTLLPKSRQTQATQGQGIWLNSRTNAKTGEYREFYVH